MRLFKLTVPYRVRRQRVSHYTEEIYFSFFPTKEVVEGVLKMRLDHWQQQGNVTRTRRVQSELAFLSGAEEWFRPPTDGMMVSKAYLSTRDSIANGYASFNLEEFEVVTQTPASLWREDATSA